MPSLYSVAAGLVNTVTLKGRFSPSLHNPTPQSISSILPTNQPMSVSAHHRRRALAAPFTVPAPAAVLPGRCPSDLCPQPSRGGDADHSGFAQIPNTRGSANFFKRLTFHAGLQGAAGAGTTGCYMSGCKHRNDKVGPPVPPSPHVLPPLVRPPAAACPSPHMAELRIDS